MSGVSARRLLTETDNSAGHHARMIEPTFTILYVDDVARSAAFYAQVLEKEPVEAAPTFTMFGLSNGAILGLWLRSTVEPPVAAGGGGAEIAIPVSDNAVVVRTHDEWSARGITIAQRPTQMDFGHTFVALDPDGHRVRVFAPSA